MYFVLYVGAGKEANAESFIRNLVPEDLYSQCFHPVKRLKKKFRREWKNIYERVIPGYVFVESDDIWGFYDEIQRLPFFKNMLGKEDDEEGSILFPLSNEEERWLRNISGLPEKRTEGKKQQEEPIVELTKVRFGKDGKLQILSGPLTNMTGQIRKMDVHKRIAEVSVDFMGRETILYLGIELEEEKQEGNEKS